MILAAGIGSRLGFLTEHTPKALVSVGDVPMLERVVRRLIAAGVDRIIINTHHHADQIVDFVIDRRSFGIEVTFSNESEKPLDTGGGLKHAARRFRRGGAFFLHNVDILTDMPLDVMYSRHVQRDPLATLAVMERPSSRYLLFDRDGLFGRVDEQRQIRIEVREPRGEPRRLAFGGVHVISPQLFELMAEQGVFSILEPYLRLAGDGYRIEPFHIDESRWIDIGKPEQLLEADNLLRHGA